MVEKIKARCFSAPRIMLERSSSAPGAGRMIGIYSGLWFFVFRVIVLISD